MPPRRPGYVRHEIYLPVALAQALKPLCVPTERSQRSVAKVIVGILSRYQQGTVPLPPLGAAADGTGSPDPAAG